jgi:hypothetical protein
MRTAIVDDVGMWFCGAREGVWAIVPAKLESGRLEIAEDDPPRLGAGRWLQMADCRVDGARVLVLFAAPFQEDDWRGLPDAARAKLDGAPLLVVLAESDGHLRVDTSFCGPDETQRSAAFMAAAVIRAKWAWDESTRIRVESAEEVVEVEPRFIDQRWSATIP